MIAALKKRYAPTNLQETMKWENKYHSLLKVRKNTNLELWFDEWEAATLYFRRYRLSQIVSNTRGIALISSKYWASKCPRSRTRNLFASMKALINSHHGDG